MSEIDIVGNVGNAVTAAHRRSDHGQHLERGAVVRYRVTIRTPHGDLRGRLTANDYEDGSSNRLFADLSDAAGRLRGVAVVSPILTEDDDDPPVVAKSGRSFDFAGYRVRLEGSAHDPHDRVPDVVTWIVDAIRQAQDGGR